MRKDLLILFALLLTWSFASAQETEDSSLQDLSIRGEVAAITRVMFHDVTDPAAAARFYAYSVLTGYEILASLEKGNSMLFAYPMAPVFTAKAGTDLQLAALYGILETGKAILPSGYRLEENQARLVRAFQRAGMSIKKISVSVEFAKQVSMAVVKHAHDDGYFKLSTLQRYKPFHTEDSWQATPPEYMAAVQPHWATIHPFFMDSAGQCKPKPMVPFSKDTNSVFFKLARDVYRTGKSLDSNQMLIASFWDCNPFAVQFEGHMSVGLKKISPGGHWMGITGIVCEQRKLSFERTMFVHTVVAMTLHDAFISCWEEKYRSNRIRPETAINRYIDEKWQPFLQTPPFPECTSGHTVISTAAAVVLSHYLGEGFSFSDSTEMYIGLPARRFSSFMAAADEAGISRFYGGIHFWDSIENGKEEGLSIGRLALGRLAKKKWVGE